ncbi:DUF3604 domain-containing protein [Halobellus captivus]|uniref:DUF3604 domain-containing protein n=1 Tax=Halobellus captivus TaxID=2592614 RepID=UPI0011A0DFD2|nr:DUF3604 domain-containing protein [Halobellus captivus]
MTESNDINSKISERIACGTLELDGPDSVVAGNYATWELTFTAGELGMDDGSALKVATSMTSDWGHPQFSDSNGDNYCTVTTSGDATVTGRFDPDGHTRPVKHAIVIDINDGSLAEGDTVTLTLGDTTVGSMGIRAQTFPENEFVFVGLVDPFGTAEYVEIDTLTVDIVPGPATALEAVAQPREKTVRIAVRAVDEWGNVAVDYAAPLTVESSTGEELSPIDVTNGTGTVTLAMSDPASTAPQRWTVRGDRLSATTNPIVPAAPVRWGDLHGQSEETVGTGSVEQYFDFARQRAFLDFISHVGNDFQITDEFWERLQSVVSRNNASGEFVTFLGYEWSANTPNGGDHNVYFRGSEGTLERSSHWQLDDQSAQYRGISKAEDLYDHYQGRDDVLIIPHQGGRPATLDIIDESLTPFFELVSVWGVFEWFGREAVERGHHLGVVGGSDDHTGRPGASRPTNHRFFLVDGGLMGVPNADLTRESLWTAFNSSRCYATTGARIHLAVTVDETPMGGTVTVENELTLDVTVAGTAPITQLDLMRDGECIASRDCTTGDDRFELVWTGARSKDRYKVRDWSGGVSISDGRFTDMEEFGFQHPEHGLQRVSSTHAKWRSKTAGNYQGVRFGVEGSTTGTLAVRTGPYSGEFSLGDLTEKHLDLGDVDTRLTCRRIGTPTDRDLTVSLTDDPSPGTYAYQIRVRQADGEMAWSSPITVRRDE